MRGTGWFAFNGGAVLLLLAGGVGCAGAPKPSSGALEAPASEPVPVAAPAITTPPAAEVSAQVRSTRTACGTEAAKQQLDVVDFVTFNRLDENNWDTTIRARRKGKLVRVGCRHDLRAGWTHIYEPAASDGGNPWGPGGPPKPTTGSGGTYVGSTGPTGSSGATTATKPAGATTPPATTPPSATRPTVPPSATRPTAPPAATRPTTTPPAPKPVPGAGINLGSIADTTARSAIARTREACLAEATRRKVAVDDFEAFRRVEGTVWEAMLVVKKARTARGCRLDLSTGKATIK